MPGKLTDVAVAKVSAKDGRRTDYPDGLIPGLMLRVSSDGSRSFSLTYRVKVVCGTPADDDVLAPSVRC